MFVMCNLHAYILPILTYFSSVVPEPIILIIGYFWGSLVTFALTSRIDHKQSGYLDAKQCYLLQNPILHCFLNYQSNF